jgi:hypothetical protein
MCVRELVNCQADLPHVVDALRAPGGGSGSLYSRQQQGHQDANDGDHNQELNQRECSVNAQHNAEIQTQADSDSR